MKLIILLLILSLVIPANAIPNPCPTFCSWAEYKKFSICRTSICTNVRLGPPAVRPCQEAWVCTSFGPCVKNWQARTCVDYNKCGTELYKPFSKRTCTMFRTNGIMYRISK